MGELLNAVISRAPVRVITFTRHDVYYTLTTILRSNKELHFNILHA